MIINIYNYIDELAEVKAKGKTIYSRTNTPLVLGETDLRNFIESYYVENGKKVTFIDKALAVAIWGTERIEARKIQVLSNATGEWETFDGELYQNRYVPNGASEGNVNYWNPIVNTHYTGVWTYEEYLSGAKFRHK